MDYRYGRKRNGIVKELREKLNDWLSTIDNPELVVMIKKNVIVTGGSIASMLLGEKVNDFDVYFKDKNTAFWVAQYYVEQMKKLKPGISTIVKEETIQNIKGEYENRVIIFTPSLGIVGENDITSILEYTSEPTEDVEDVGEKYRPVFLSENAITLSHKIQIVTRFYGEPDKIHDNYDFAHAMCYYDYWNDELVLPAEAMECLLSRTLIYRGSLYPIASIFRVRKFVERGWRISAGQLLKIMWQISEIDLKDYAVLKEQLTGVDQAYLYMLVEALKDVPSDDIDSKYVTAIIDKIFD